MKKGFTLLELLIVVIIIGVLAALGLNQYSRTIEKSRSAEVKNMVGQIRQIASAYYQGHGTMTGFTADMANIGPNADQLPSVCRDDHFFYITGMAVTAVNHIEINCNRCGATGKGGANPYAGGLLNAGISFPGEKEDWGGEDVYR